MPIYNEHLKNWSTKDSPTITTLFVKSNGEVEKREHKALYFRWPFAIFMGYNEADVMNKHFLIHLPSGYSILSSPNKKKVKEFFQLWIDEYEMCEEKEKWEQEKNQELITFLAPKRRNVLDKYDYYMEEEKRDKVPKPKVPKPFDSTIKTTTAEVSCWKLQELTISGIARLIGHHWKDGRGNSCVYFGAKPYLDAMFRMESIRDVYGADEGSSIIAYFLCNATTWRGPAAREIKKELNRRLKQVRNC